MPSLRELDLCSSYRDDTLSFGRLRKQLEVLRVPASTKFAPEGRWEKLTTLMVFGEGDKNQTWIEGPDGWAPYLKELHVGLEA